MANCPDSVKKLVERFEQQRDDFTSGKYNETQLRREFLDPLFEALGWDMINTSGHAEAYKDVIHEDAVKINGSTKAPDYSFRIGGFRKFFVEAKKPSVNVKDDVGPALQLRRYAWSAKLPLGIVSDFEEFAVYDTRVRPTKNDKAVTARVAFFTYKDYLTRWDEISGVFAKDSILNGSFDRFAEASGSKKGTTEVDEAFLKEIESWRDILARTIAIRNSSLSQPELNFAVQRTIDRIVFLRICEDRGIEKYGRLREAIDGVDVYKNLLKIFKEADEKYDSGLFHFQKEKEESEPPDTLTLGISIDDKPLKEIIGNLYFPESPYEFSVLPAEILGYVYEQFLGKVIRLTADHHAKIEEKPEVKKAHGVYYTPTYIVDYIVRHTIGPLIEGKTPKQASKVKIVDPACGSGAFLIGAYQFLLDWHRDWYLNNGPEKYANTKVPTLYKNVVGDWRLTTIERKRILLDNIYGVDIDLQAVEVTKLSLLLKVLEGESQETLRQMKLFNERVLPYLGRNIKCGNSLVGPDFYSDSGTELLSMEERVKINVFDWKKEYANIFADGGFDAVIGNPPYVFGGNKGIEDLEKRYFANTYVSGGGKVNLFTLFFEKSASLAARGGFISFIIPNTFLRVTSYKKSREFMLKNLVFLEVRDLGSGIFEGATTSSIIIVLKNNKPTIKDVIEVGVGLNGDLQKVQQSEFLGDGYVINTGSSSEDRDLLEKIKKSGVLLGTLCKEMIFGVVISSNRDQVVSETYQNGFKNFLEGKDIGRYVIRSHKYLNYVPKLLHRARTPEVFEVPEKLLVQRITGGNRPLSVAYDNQKFYDKESINNLILKEGIGFAARYILSLLNSRVINWFYGKSFTNESKLTVNISKEYLSLIPIVPIDVNNKEIHDRLISCAEKMMTLQRQLLDSRTEQEKSVATRQIEVIDGEIDSLVYKLYRLTDEEIRLVKEGTK